MNNCSTCLCFNCIFILYAASRWSFKFKIPSAAEFPTQIEFIEDSNKMAVFKCACGNNRPENRMYSDMSGECKTCPPGTVATYGAIAYPTVQRACFRISCSQVSVDIPGAPFGATEAWDAVTNGDGTEPCFFNNASGLYLEKMGDKFFIGPKKGAVKASTYFIRNAAIQFPTQVSMIKDKKDRTYVTSNITCTDGVVDRDVPVTASPAPEPTNTQHTTAPTAELTNSFSALEKFCKRASRYGCMRRRRFRRRCKWKVKYIAIGTRVRKRGSCVPKFSSN